LLTWADWDDEGGISLPACGREFLPELLRDARWLAAQQGYNVAFWIAPLTDEIMSAAEAAGYVPYREHDNYLYEKKHSG
jgi:hypothetical protein